MIDKGSQEVQGSYWVAYLKPQGNQSLILHAQDYDGRRVQASEITAKEAQSIYERGGAKRGSQVT